MKISFYCKPFITKAISVFIMLSFIVSTPLQANAGFFSDLTDKVFGTSEASTIVEEEKKESVGAHNSQTLPLLESSINPDLKNTNEPEDIIIVQDDSFIYSDGSFDPGVKFEKSPLSDKISVYTVEKGDTLSEIAELFDVSPNTIRWENNLSGGNISVGQKLNILPVTGVKHIIKSGDTISKIADKYEAESEDIFIFNDITKDTKLKQGDIIFVPNGIIKAVAPKATSSGSSKSSSSNTKVQSGYYQRPVSGIITSKYGSRRGGFHYGVDIGNKRGTPVAAAASGVVVKVVSGCVEGKKSCGGRYGNYIEIEHPNGTTTIYGHLSKVSVSSGESVSQGQTIGAVGNTGSSTGPHLHFEIENANGSKMRPPF
jgi:murein DD-endopeptidase MepM/ murein hydrolase activator NlpD